MSHRAKQLITEEVVISSSDLLNESLRGFEMQLTNMSVGSLKMLFPTVQAEASQSANGKQKLDSLKKYLTQKGYMTDGRWHK